MVVIVYHKFHSHKFIQIDFFLDYKDFKSTDDDILIQDFTVQIIQTLINYNSTFQVLFNFAIKIVNTINSENIILANDKINHSDVGYFFDDYHKVNKVIRIGIISNLNIVDIDNVLLLDHNILNINQDYKILDTDYDTCPIFASFYIQQIFQVIFF